MCIRDSSKNIGAQAVERGDDRGHGLAFCLAGEADDQYAIGGGCHLQALGETQQGRRVEDDQVIFLAKFVEQRREAWANEVGRAMRAGAGRQKEEVGLAFEMCIRDRAATERLRSGQGKEAILTLTSFSSAWVP